MGDGGIDWLVYVDTPDWSREGDWRQHISKQLRAAWPTLTYEQKWTIAQKASRVPRSSPPSLVRKVRAELDEQGGVTPVDRPDAEVPPP